MTLVIGLVGKISAGKGAIAEHLADRYDASVYRFSDVLKDLLQRLHLPDTRENLQNLGVVLRGAFGDGVLATALGEDIKKDEAEVIVVDGIRYENEVRMLRGFENNVLIFVTAPVEVRYKRATGRGTRGEKGLSLKEFKKLDNRETERLIDTIGKKADIRIENTGSLKELYEKVDRVVRDRLSKS